MPPRRKSSFSKSLQIVLFLLAVLSAFCLTYFPELPVDYAYNQGYRVGLSGVSFEENPFRGMADMDKLYAAWSDGWREGWVRRLNHLHDTLVSDIVTETE